ncbi:calcium-binding protein [Bradyrhizobium sp. WD16]|uniref:calcium-binding protein n=1 Tax=Bradyrhizobium sp. WD16 TaxID=1521768 RepID=UPI0020A453FE|nr:hypothetical protein [Bradyrhizobium sp. WD16]
MANGGAGNDRVTGGNAADILLGGDGVDTLVGNGGSDNLIGGAGNDVLDGGAGIDILRGNQGNDEYQTRIGNAGIDTVADDLSAANAAGFGGGTADYIHVLDSTGSTLMLFQNGNDLLVTNATDVADGSIDSGAAIHNFFLGGNNVVEFAIGSDGNGYDLTSLLATSVVASAAQSRSTVEVLAPVWFDGHEVQQLQASPFQHADFLI